MENKIAIVLGTSSGLGLACASSLLDRGFLVYGASRSESSLEHPNFIDIEMDLTQEGQIKSFISEVKTETEVVDVLVNSIGHCDMGAFGDTSSLDMRMHLETNVVGHFNFYKYFEPLILSGSTHIINLFSISAKSFFPNTVAYTSSEHAKLGLVKTLEKEWKKYQIRFSNLFIGAVDTPLWEEYPEIETDKMLSIEDFSYMFEMLIDAPAHIQFPDLTFLHEDGFIE